MLLRLTTALILLSVQSCGTSELRDIKSHRPTTSTYTLPTDLDANAVRQDDYLQDTEYAFASDNVLASYYIPIKTGQDALSLTDLDMQDNREILACVGANKYLQISGQLSIPIVPDTYGVVDIGCLDISMKDNVYYLEQTKLVVITNGVRGERIQQVQIPLQIDHNGWQTVPPTPESFDLEVFAQESIKKFTKKVCFQLQFGEVPAQAYSGEIQIHYLKPDNTPNYEDEIAMRCNPVTP